MIHIADSQLIPKLAQKPEEMLELVTKGVTSHGYLPR